MLQIQEPSQEEVEEEQQQPLLESDDHEENTGESAEKVRRGCHNCLRARRINRRNMYATARNDDEGRT